MIRGNAIRRIAIVAVFLVGAPLGAALTPEQRQLNIKSFEYVWTAIRDRHWQTKPGGLDWQAIHEEFRPKIEAADSMEAARGVMSDMLGRLHQTHFNIVPGDLYSTVDTAHACDTTTGIDVRLVDAQVVVTSIEPDSPAFHQGVKPGWAILKIGGTDLAPIVAKLNEAYAGSTLRDLMLRRTILGQLAGDAGAPVQVEFLDADGKPAVKTLVPGQPKGDRVQFGFLSPMQVWFNASKVGDGKIGYVAFNVFLDAQVGVSLERIDDVHLDHILDAGRYAAHVSAMVSALADPVNFTGTGARAEARASPPPHPASHVRSPTATEYVLSEPLS